MREYGRVVANLRTYVGLKEVLDMRVRDEVGLKEGNKGERVFESRGHP